MRGEPGLTRHRFLAIILLLKRYSSPFALFLSRRDERERRREARLQRYLAKHCQWQNKRGSGITDATIITYEQHIAWQDELREHRAPAADPSDPRCFCAGVCSSRDGRGPFGPKLRNMPTRCGAYIPPEGLSSLSLSSRNSTATSNFKRETRYPSRRNTTRIRNALQKKRDFRRYGI